MTSIQALFLAFVQGATELFPVSSLGHAVILPKLLGWQLSTRDVAFLPFLVLLHLGTGLALLIYFRQEWIRLITGVLGRGDPAHRQADCRLLWLLAIGTAPAVVVGFLLEKLFQVLFANPPMAAIFLILNGVMLILGERLRPERSSTADTLAGLSTLTARKALLIGLAQCAALFPGISRSGATIVAGLRLGLKHEDAARFSFLLATPIILGAALLEIPKLHNAGDSIGMIDAAAGLVAGLTAFATVALMMRYLGRHEFRALNPFGWYCIGFGALSFLWIALA